MRLLSILLLKIDARHDADGDDANKEDDGIQRAARAYSSDLEKYVTS